MYSIRQATDADLATLLAFRGAGAAQWPPPQLVRRWISDGNCWVACVRERVAGYSAIEHTFHEQGFVAKLHVDQDYRRRGIGTGLMRRMRELCETEKLWTSTNLSNHPMQALLTRLGYRLSGALHYLDEDDPELIYVNLGPQTNV